MSPDPCGIRSRGRDCRSGVGEPVEEDGGRHTAGDAGPRPLCPELRRRISSSIPTTRRDLRGRPHRGRPRPLACGHVLCLFCLRCLPGRPGPRRDPHRSRERALQQQPPAQPRAVRAGPHRDARRRADELDGQVAGGVPGLRRGGVRCALPRRRRPRLRRPLPGRHRSHDRALTGTDRRDGARAGRPGHHRDAADRGRRRRRRGARAGGSGCRCGSSPCRPPTPTGTSSATPGT